MKKLFLSFVAAMMAATATYAQSSLIAMLTHEGNVSVFHGSSSYKQAMEAAENGDIISLAGGIYQATDITKGVTVLGSGMEIDKVSNSYPTEIQGNFTINISNNSSKLLIEGVYCSGTVSYTKVKNPVFKKSKFYQITYSGSSAKIENLTMQHCYVTSKLYLNDNSTANLINSYIYGLSGSSLDITNCYIYGYVYNIAVSQIRNSLIYDYNGSYASTNRLPQTNMVYNCVGYGKNIFEYHPINNNITLSQSEWNELFEENSFCQLTDEAKEKCQGDDGTEVGLYGGSQPYDIRISKPQITKCNIAQKTTVDGKLSVDIEVKGVE